MRTARHTEAPPDPASRARRFLLSAAALSAAALSAAGPAATPPAFATAPPAAASAAPRVLVPAASHPGRRSRQVVTFGVQPAGPHGPDGRGYFSFDATPGGQVTDRVAVANYSYQRLALAIYTTDAVNTPQGGFALLPPTQPPHDLGTWVALPAGLHRVVVPPRGFVLVPFRVSVPPYASPGDHVGGIVVVLASEARSRSGQRYRLLQDVGARMFLRVSGPLHPRLAVAVVSARYHGTVDPVGTGSATVTYTVRNTGNVVLAGQPALHVSGVFGGTGAALRLPRVPLLLPGYGIRLTVRAGGVWPEVLLRARVVVRPLVVAGTVQPASGPFQSATLFWAVPWVLLLLLVLLFGIAVGWWRRRRRRPGTHAHRAAAASSGRGGTERTASGRHRERGVRVGGRSLRAVRRTVTPALAALLAVGAVPAEAQADGLPFRDAAARGYLGLCDPSGDPVLSGGLGTRPFAWSALSSVPAPTGYEKGKAVLWAFQPRPGVVPGLWSGYQLTASSSFTDPAHPVAQSTYADPPLLYFVEAYPPRWQGLVELRMYFASPQGLFKTTYPATVLRVRGARWTVVSGGRVDCHAGRGRSFETVELPASRLRSAPPAPVPGYLARATWGAPSAGDGPWLGLGVALAVLVLVGGGWVLVRRRP